MKNELEVRRRIKQALSTYTADRALSILQEADTAIENLWRGIEQGQSVEMLTERLHKRQAEKQEL